MAIGDGVVAGGSWRGMGECRCREADCQSEELGDAGWRHVQPALQQAQADQRQNVGKMQVAWMFSTGVLRGHEGSPLVIGNTMYMHSPFPNKVFAIDLDTQKIMWRYEPKQDAAVIPQMCCDTVNRGLAYAESKIFLQQADSMLVALDAKTGKVIWSREERRSETRRRQHQCAARVQGQGDHRDLRRRVGRARFPCRLRHQYRQAGLEGVQHRSRCTKC